MRVKHHCSRSNAPGPNTRTAAMWLVSNSPACCDDGHVLVLRARVPDRHHVVAELDHVGAVLDVPVEQRGVLLVSAHGCLEIGRRSAPRGRVTLARPEERTSGAAWPDPENSISPGTSGRTSCRGPADGFLSAMARPWSRARSVRRSSTARPRPGRSGAGRRGSGWRFRRSRRTPHPGTRAAGG